MRQLIRATAIYVVLMAIPIVGCNDALNFKHSVNWVEDVEVAEGVSVRVARSVTFTVSRPMGEKTAGIDQFLSSSIESESRDFPVPKFDAVHLVPILLREDSEAKDLILVATTDSCAVWALNGKPMPVYWAFRMHERAWYRTDVSEKLFGLGANLLNDVRPDDRGNLSRGEVVRRKQQLTQLQKAHPRFLSILPSAKLDNCKNIESFSAGDFESMGKM